VTRWREDESTDGISGVNDPVHQAATSGNRQLLHLLALAGTCLLATGILYSNSIVVMLSRWGTEEYSHGYLIPVIAAYLVWRKRSEIAACRSDGSYVGLVVLCLGLVVFFLGELSMRTAVTN